MSILLGMLLGLFNYQNLWPSHAIIFSIQAIIMQLIFYKMRIWLKSWYQGIQYILLSI